MRAVGLTRRGWTVAGSAAGLLVGGRVLGADALNVLGLAAIAVVAGALLWVACTRRSLRVTRHVAPPRLHVDDPARVDLVVATTHATPLLELTEAIDDRALRARFLLAPMAPGTQATTAYRLPTRRRGAVSLGPTTIGRTDPLGLARVQRAIASPETVLVRPRVHPISPPMPGAGARHAEEDIVSPRAPASDAGGEFLAVRPYAVGDDPRRVHWRSSARTDELMVRQFVAPRRGHTVVMLDTRAPTSGAASEPSDPFEHAVEATASVVSALVRARRPVECMTTAGTTIAALGSNAPRMLDRLATVMPDEPDLLDAVVAQRLRRAAELVVLVTAHYDDRIRAAQRLLARRMPVLLVVTGGSGPDGQAGRVVDARHTPFPDAWRTAEPRHRAGRTTLTASERSLGSWTSDARSRPPSRSPR